jgi:hypothetical protein
MAKLRLHLTADRELKEVNVDVTDLLFDRYGYA